jgi:hypothetical protein
MARALYTSPARGEAAVGGSHDEAWRHIGGCCGAGLAEEVVAEDQAVSATATTSAALRGLRGPSAGPFWAVSGP